MKSAANKNIHILVVDDDTEIREMISERLQREGFQVSAASNGKIALETAQLILPNLILMDVMMPELDGIETCRRIKENPAIAHIPVLFLTARNEEFAELAGFGAGAEDYIAKPVRLNILISRIDAILRRTLHSNQTNFESKTDCLTFPGLIIDKSRHVVEFEDQTVQLPKKEFALLYYLAQHPGRVFTREEILENVWGNDIFVVDRTIDVHIRKIREKLNNLFIYTVKGIGYKFEIK